MDRRRFIYLMLALAGAAAAASPLRRLLRGTFRDAASTGAAAPRSRVYVAKNGTPQENVRKIVEMMGGIERFVDARTIVVIKPNAQWWNQGRTNLAAMKGFIDLVLGVPGFKGEVIIAENHHFMDESLPHAERDNIRGWTHLSEINGDIDGVNHSINTLIGLYHKEGRMNVTKRHLRDGGPKPKLVWGNGSDGGIVKGPWEGDGYVWSDDDYVYSPLMGLKTWKVKMTYPVFTSTFSGITVDLRNGAYLRDGKGAGRYLKDVPVKLVNFAVLNTHGKDTGITSALKNYMGITDLSCGKPGLRPEGYHNVHKCGEPFFRHAKAGPIAHFIKTVRRADLNIVAAEWVGFASRTAVKDASRTRTVLAGLDPVALDYWGARHVMLPLGGPNAAYHDPDDPGSPCHKFLRLASETLGEGAMDDASISALVHDFSGR